PSRAPASSVRRMRRATAASVRRWMHTVRQEPRPCAAGTESSTSRRCSPRTCRALRPRGWSPRCRRSTCSGASLTAPTTGRGRSASGRAFPIRSLRESGALVALGSDWPVVRFDPRLGLAAARLRRPPGERDRSPYDDEAIDGLAALEGYTTNAAATIGEQEWL